MWLSPSGQVAHTTLDWRLCRTRIFNELAKEFGVDPRPNETLVEIDEFNDWLFPHINNSHYRMAFCQSLGAYDEAYEDFYESLDKLDKCLETNRFLFGDYITYSDVRAYVTLTRSLP